MNDPLFVRRLERFGDLLRDGQSLGDRDRAARNALREVLALDELHDEGTHAAGFLDAVDGGNLG